MDGYMRWWIFLDRRFSDPFLRFLNNLVFLVFFPGVFLDVNRGGSTIIASCVNVFLILLIIFFIFLGATKSLSLLRSRHWG